jgi:hypothetical protein
VPRTGALSGRPCELTATTAHARDAQALRHFRQHGLSIDKRPLCWRYLDRVRREAVYLRLERVHTALDVQNALGIRSMGSLPGTTRYIIPLSTTGRPSEVSEILIRPRGAAPVLFELLVHDSRRIPAWRAGFKGGWRLKEPARKHLAHKARERSRHDDKVPCPSPLRGRDRADARG